MAVNLIDTYAVYLKSNEKLSTTIEDYTRQLRTLNKFLQSKFQVSLDIESVNKVMGYMLGEYYNSMADLSIKSRNYYVIIIKGFFKYLTESMYIDKNPSDVLHVIKEKKKHEEDFDEQESKMYTGEEVISLIRSNSGYNAPRNAAIVAMLAGTGLRATELCELTIGQYRHMRNGMIYCHRKTDIWKWVPVSSYVIQYIDVYLATRGLMKDDDPLFMSTHGGHLNRKSLWKLLSTRQNNEGVSTGVHKFRHTFLTAVGKAGGGIIARDIGSQKDIKVTNGYLHSTKEERVEAANAVPWNEELEKK